MEKQHPIGDLMNSIVDKVREIADANTIVGQAITAGGVTIIPISRLSVGVGSGGTEFASKHKKPEDNSCFGGGAGAGVNLIPVGFLIGKAQKLLQVPGNGLSLPVRVRCKIDRIRIGCGGFQFLDKGFLSPDGDILGRKVVLQVHAHFAFGQVPQMAHAGLYGVVRP